MSTSGAAASSPTDDERQQIDIAEATQRALTLQRPRCLGPIPAVVIPDVCLVELHANGVGVSGDPILRNDYRSVRVVALSAEVLEGLEPIERKQQ